MFKIGASAHADRGTPPGSSTMLEGKYVELKDTLRGFQEILAGKHDDIPEQAFYLVGTIEEVLAKAQKLAA